MCATDCVLVGLDWAKPMMLFYIACHMFMHSHAYVLSFQYILIYCELFWDFFDCLLSLSLPLSVYVSLFLWHRIVNLLCPRTLFVSGHPLLLTLLLSLFGFVIRRPNRTFVRTFHNKSFIRNAKSFCQIFLTLTYPLSFTVGVRSHCVASWSCALP